MIVSRQKGYTFIEYLGRQRDFNEVQAIRFVEAKEKSKI